MFGSTLGKSFAAAALVVGLMGSGAAIDAQAASAAAVSCSATVKAPFKGVNAAVGSETVTCTGTATIGMQVSVMRVDAGIGHYTAGTSTAKSKTLSDSLTCLTGAHRYQTQASWSIDGGAHIHAVNSAIVTLLTC
jgi:hypothetical protein